MSRSGDPAHIRISLLHATRGRPETALRVRTQWLAAAAHPERVEHLFGIDVDDAASLRRLASLPHRTVAEPGRGCVAAWNLAANASVGDVLVQLSDDWSPVPRWDEEIVRRLRDVTQPGVLRVSDGYRTDDLLCMAICTRSWMEASGHFFYPGYFGVFSDDEFSFRAYEAGVVIDARDLVFRHHHPSFDPTIAIDETYARQNNSAVYRRGLDLFIARNPRARTGWLHEQTGERRFLPPQHTPSPHDPAQAWKRERAQLEETCTDLEAKMEKQARQWISLMGKRSHAGMYRATATQAVALLESARRSLAGKIGFRRRHQHAWEAIQTSLATAEQRRNSRDIPGACQAYLETGDAALDLLEQLAQSPWLRTVLRRPTIALLRSQHEAHKKWWHDVAQMPALRADAARRVEAAPRIVGLVPARNEGTRMAFCLRALARFTDAIVYLDDCSDDDTVAVVESLARECRVERILRKDVWHRDEPADRNALLQAGREIGGTHFVVLDADEAFTSNCLTDDFLRRKILALEPGDHLTLHWIQLWRGVGQYRFDASVWTWNTKPFAFRDNGKCAYASEFIHTPRIPAGLQGKTHAIEGYTHGVLHFQFVNWRNLLVKQAWYRCLERIRDPDKTVAEINARYAPATDETDLGLKESPAEWLAGYEFFDPEVFDAPYRWREDLMKQWFADYGPDFFEGLELAVLHPGTGPETTRTPASSPAGA